MKQGVLIAIEGIDGAGKTTQAALLRESLVSKHYSVASTREPTRGHYGQLIRQSTYRGEVAAPEDELDWFMKDRREHVDQVIAPALERGEVVITDRYFLSTVAYQGARGIPYESILLTSEALFPAPDLAVVLEIPPDEGLARVHARGAPINPVFERVEFLAQVDEVFRQIQRPYITRIDGRLPIADVQKATASAISMRLGLI